MKTHLEKLKETYKKYNENGLIIGSEFCEAILKDDKKNKSYSTIRRYERMIENIKRNSK